jgi:hypothetical protein
MSEWLMSIVAMIAFTVKLRADYIRVLLAAA